MTISKDFEVDVFLNQGAVQWNWSQDQMAHKEATKQLVKHGEKQ